MVILTPLKVEVWIIGLVLFLVVSVLLTVIGRYVQCSSLRFISVSEKKIQYEIIHVLHKMKRTNVIRDRTTNQTFDATNIFGKFTSF